MQDLERKSSVDAQTPEWYHLYFEAVLEADAYKALIQIERASRAIEHRLGELRFRLPDNPNEIQDLNSALTYLKLLVLNI